MQSRLNLGIFAHIDSGKTTLTERILFEAEEIHAPGTIRDGTTESDSLQQEIKRGISILASILSFSYSCRNGDLGLTLIDTPGHIDFQMQWEYHFRTVDLAVLIIDATTGVKSQTELLIQKLQTHGVPYIVFLNKMDISSFSRPELLAKISTFFSIPVLFLDSQTACPGWDLPVDSSESNLVRFFEWNDALSEKYLLDNQTLAECFRRGLAEGFWQKKLIPVLSGSAYLGDGVRELLECLQFLATHIPEKNTHPPQATLIQKRIHPELGKIGYFCFHGPPRTIEQKFYYHNHEITWQEGYRIGLHDCRPLKQIQNRDIFAASLPLPLQVGDVLVDHPHHTSNQPLRLDYTRQFSVLLEPLQSEDRQSLWQGVEKLIWEDNGLEYRCTDFGQILLKGCGELHLEVSLQRLREFCGNIFSFGKLKVARYELIKNIAKTKFSFEHSTYSGTQKSGVLKGFIEKNLDLKPRVHFHVNLADDLRDSIESGFFEVLAHGDFGHVILGCNITITSYQQPEQVSEHTISLVKISVISGIKSIIKGNTLEIGPIHLFEVTVPQEFLGQVIANLQMRSAKIQEIDSMSESVSFIKGEAPAEKLIGFASALRNVTKGKGTISVVTLFNSKKFSYVR